MTDDDQPVRLTSNEYWGKKSGAIVTDSRGRSERIIPGRRAGNNGTGNSGPTGKRKTRWYQGRALAKPGPKGK